MLHESFEGIMKRAQKVSDRRFPPDTGHSDIEKKHECVSWGVGCDIAMLDSRNNKVPWLYYRSIGLSSRNNNNNKREKERERERE